MKEEPVDDELDKGLVDLEMVDEKFDPDAIIEDDPDAEDDEEQAEQDEKDINQLLKEEDINLVPESSDVSEVDKLTGNPSYKDML